MMTREVGARIGAILGSDDKTVKLLGYGVYEGDFVPPETTGGFNTGRPNPRLKLDSGKVVWGCECWWGSEAKMKSEIEKWTAAGYVIIAVDIDDARRAAAS